MSKRIVQEINAGSMADIAFLLLIFFLVTTAMNTDMGIMRKLPPPALDAPPVEINKRNLLEVWINRDNNVMIQGEIIGLNELKEKTKEFIANYENSDELPEFEELDIPYIGRYAVTNDHVISLQNDRGTSYKTYVTVQNELTAAYNELRDEFSREKWGIAYLDLDDKRKEAVETVYPMHISEAEPR